MNKVIMIGNLVKDPESSTTGNGITMCRFSIAVNRNYVNANNERETDFFNIVTWRGLAENCGKYLAKGRKVAVVGTLQNRSYEDKDGTKKYYTDIIAEDVEFLTPKADGEGFTGAGTGAGKSVSAPELKPVESDDLPF